MNQKIARRFLTFLFALPPLVLWADVKPAALFADRMVIQQNTRAPVWGTGDAGEAVTVTGSWGEKADTVVDENGQWQVHLKTPPAGGPHTLTLQGKNTIEIQDILSGEIWFCSGQSNMDFYLKQLMNSKAGRTSPEDQITAEYINREVTTAKDDQLRQFEVQKNTSPFEPLDTLNGNWISSSPGANQDFSATAYFFARELRKELQVPVGIIKCAWGGTRVEPWIPADLYQQDKDMAAYLQQEHALLKEAIANWSPPKEDAGNKRRAARPPVSNQQIPATLFNGMVNPVIPYAIKGAIWYQGESNAKYNTHLYAKHFEAMISGWRTHWGQGDFPFYFAQLASFREESTTPLDQDPWASVCDQQRRTLRLKNTGMAVLNDIGEARDVHPHNKIDVGVRLALWALKNDYGRNIPACSGPLYRSHEIKDGDVILTFDHAGSGLMTGSKNNIEPTVETGDPIKGFQICGRDRQWKWAEANITGPNTITVSHKDIPEPSIVRYAWAANPGEVNLYNREGLPASIFTTEAEIPAVSAPPEKARPERRREAANRAPIPAAARESSARPERNPKQRKKVLRPEPTHADVAYDVHERTRLDFWQADGNGPRPVKVFIHGGGWITGDKSQFRDADKYLAKGISVAAVNYRLSETDPLPAPVHDAVRAIQFLRSKATEWNIDKNKFVLTGGSAGGCSSVWIACHDDMADPNSEDPVERESSRVQGIAVRGAQTSIDPKQVEPWIGPNVYHPMIYMAVGEESIEAAQENYAKHAATYKEFSAYNHLSADDPPLFLGYGADLTVPARNVGHGIHHGMFGVKLKEKSEAVGHNQVHLMLGRTGADAKYKHSDQFIEAILLGE